MNQSRKELINYLKIITFQGQFVLVQKGIVSKEKFYIPKDIVESYNGYVLRFRFLSRI